MTAPAVLAVICARGGSKGLPGKNLANLGGLPLLAWTILTARAAPGITRLILSTDDPAIAACARDYGCEVPFLRPAELARDDTPSEPVLRHAVATLPERYDHLMLLQPTSPFRTVDDIQACIVACATGAPACVSVTPAPLPPEWMFRLSDNGQMVPVLGHQAIATRRQNLPASYQLNGAVYVGGTDWFLANGRFFSPDTKGHVMPPERSLDIDTAADLDQARHLLASGRVVLPALAAP